MATLDGLLDHAWDEAGADCRTHVREALCVIEEMDSEPMPKLLAAFFWAIWAGGRDDAPGIADRNCGFKDSGLVRGRRCDRRRVGTD
jgi:hypothetical protein